MQIDFYVMDDASRMQAWRQLCMLLEAPYALQQPVFVHVDTMEEANQLDKLLWTYRDDSFLAHEIAHEASTAPILIGMQTPASAAGVLVNLTGQVPASLRQFQRIIELVFADPVVQQNARQRYRHYREQGLELNTHKIKVNEPV